MTLADLEALEPEWEALWRSDPRATPFQSPAWLIPWTRHLWGGGELIFLKEREAGRLTGLCLLFRWSKAGVPVVSFLGAGVSDYGDILGSFRQIHLPREAILEEVRPSSALLRCRAEPCSVCPVLSLLDYPDELDAKLRTDLHRASNRLAKHNPQFSVSATPDVFFQLHAKRWNAEPDARLEAFQREVAERFAARTLLRIHLLHVDGEPAAALFAISAHGTLYCYLSAFDPQFTKLSPGAVLLKHAIESAKSEGLTSVDFLRGSEPYKYLWGAKDRPTYRLRLGTSNEESTEQSES